MQFYEQWLDGTDRAHPLTRTQQLLTYVMWATCFGRAECSGWFDVHYSQFQKSHSRHDEPTYSLSVTQAAGYRQIPQARIELPDLTFESLTFACLLLEPTRVDTNI